MQFQFGTQFFGEGGEDMTSISAVTTVVSVVMQTIFQPRGMEILVARHWLCEQLADILEVSFGQPSISDKTVKHQQHKTHNSLQLRDAT